MPAKTLMLQGTTSDAGKSTLVTALCRALHRRGISVAPFKPQNMALNSAVTHDGGEIGRAQAVQAQACGLSPCIDMNPVLLKPNSDIGAQIIIHGKAISNMDAQGYHDYKTTAMQAVLESHQRLSHAYQAIIVEGAGSPAEINLRDKDIANMGFAEAVDCPVILIADIDRGGVFAHLVGTLALLSPSEQNRVIGFIINRFRGDIALLQSGLDWLEQKTGKPVLGVLPYLQGLHLEAEDAIQATNVIDHKQTSLKVIIPVLPRISNHNDFDALRMHPQIDCEFIGPNQPIPAADLIIIPGTKSVRADRMWMQQQGWDDVIKRHLRYEGRVMGICGGFQILGRTISDPLGIEGNAGTCDGLGLFDFKTELKSEKILTQVEGYLKLESNASTDIKVFGYEIHAGVSIGRDLDYPLVQLADRNDGAISTDKLIIGTYLHGIFESPDAMKALLTWAGFKNIASYDYAELRERNIDRLADSFSEHINLQTIYKYLEL